MGDIEGKGNIGGPKNPEQCKLFPGERKSEPGPLQQPVNTGINYGQRRGSLPSSIYKGPFPRLQFTPIDPNESEKTPITQNEGPSVSKKTLGILVKTINTGRRAIAMQTLIDHPDSTAREWYDTIASRMNLPPDETSNVLGYFRNEFKLPQDMVGEIIEAVPSGPRGYPIYRVRQEYLELAKEFSDMMIYYSYLFSNPVDPFLAGRPSQKAKDPYLPVRFQVIECIDEEFWNEDANTPEYGKVTNLKSVQTPLQMITMTVSTNLEVLANPNINGITYEAAKPNEEIYSFSLSSNAPPDAPIPPQEYLEQHRRTTRMPETFIRDMYAVMQTFYTNQQDTPHTRSQIYQGLIDRNQDYELPKPPDPGDEIFRQIGLLMDYWRELGFVQRKGAHSVLYVTENNDFGSAHAFVSFIHRFEQGDTTLPGEVSAFIDEVYSGTIAQEVWEISQKFDPRNTLVSSGILADQIRSIITGSQKPLTPMEIAEAVGKSSNTSILPALRKLVEDGLVVKDPTTTYDFYKLSPPEEFRQSITNVFHGGMVRYNRRTKTTEIFPSGNPEVEAAWQRVSPVIVTNKNIPIVSITSETERIFLIKENAVLQDSLFYQGLVDVLNQETRQRYREMRRRGIKIKPANEFTVEDIADEIRYPESLQIPKVEKMYQNRDVVLRKRQERLAAMQGLIAQIQQRKEVIKKEELTQQRELEKDRVIAGNEGDLVYMSENIDRLIQEGGLVRVISLTEGVESKTIVEVYPLESAAFKERWSTIDTDTQNAITSPDISAPIRSYDFGSYRVFYLTPGVFDYFNNPATTPPVTSGLRKNWNALLENLQPALISIFEDNTRQQFLSPDQYNRLQMSIQQARLYAEELVKKPKRSTKQDVQDTGEINPDDQFLQ